MTLEKKAAQLRIDIINELYAAQSGHPGGSLSCIDALTALYYNVMNGDPANPQAPQFAPGSSLLKFATVSSTGT